MPDTFHPLVLTPPVEFSTHLAVGRVSLCLRPPQMSPRMSVCSREEAAVKAKEELQAAESKLTMMGGEPGLGDNPAKMNCLKSQNEKTEKEELSARESLETKEALFAQAYSFCY